MRFLYAFLILLTFMTAPARAQDILRDHRADDPSALLDGNIQKPETEADYANLYYERCLRSNEDPVMKEYVATQCACTSVKMMEFMNLKDMEALFTRTQEGNFQQARILMLAYAPCMYDSVYDFVFDGCYFSKENQQTVRHRRAVCECYAGDMANHVAKNGYKFIPGLGYGSFNPDLAVPNPLLHILEGNNFRYASNSTFRGCMMRKEYFPRENENRKPIKRIKPGN